LNARFASTERTPLQPSSQRCSFSLFFILVTGPRSSVSLKLSDTRVYEPQIRARLGTTVLKPEIWSRRGPRMRSSSTADSKTAMVERLTPYTMEAYLRLLDCVYHATLGLRVIMKKKEPEVQPLTARASYALFLHRRLKDRDGPNPLYHHDD